MVIFAEILRVSSLAILVFSSFMYLSDLTIKKKQRSLTTFEFAMYIILAVAVIAFGISMLIPIITG
ncbi:hypothetical protein [Virgibacillus salexigens]|uniref:DUF1146 domain-containing protein n=1 Tax=Virgibacillus massiliensis TaxID=1462526 RepID=A0A024QHJ8_9BACI|nr:hypothetical protein [Virgibacillus massiliensis]CDQ41737.1 hypothetical protein BN990_04114 [Virgibacillus massiliensis]